MSETPLLELIDVSKRYESPDGGAGLTVLDGVNLRLRSGDAIAIVGPSGSGKSTLLNLIGALDRPTRGRVLLEGQDLANLGNTEIARVRNRRIGLVFQAHHLLPQCTVWENVLVPTLADGADRRSAHERARRLLDRVELGARLAHRPGQLSGGECQRVAVVRALVNSPSLLLADEPTGSLDRASAGNLAELLLELNAEEGTGLIVVTHSLDLARRVGDVRELRDGRLSDRKGGA